MFSYLKPHKRTPSNPVSPISTQSHSFERVTQQTPEQQSHPYTSRILETNSPQDHSRTSSSTLSSLTPIARASSLDKELPPLNRQNGGLKQSDIKSFEPPITRLLNANHFPYNTQSWAEQQASQRSAIRNDSEPSQYLHLQSSYSQPGNNMQQAQGQSQGGARLPFVTSADLQTTHAHTSRRPMGARMPTPPPTLPANPISTFEVSQKSSSKTRLNLLNPMSLLARRRTSHPVPQLLSVPTRNYPTQLSPSDFDPRIRGTKVHDFSAPRPRPTVSHGKTPEVKTASGAPVPLQADGRNEKARENGERNPQSGGDHTPVFKEDFEEEQYPAAGPHVRKASDLSDLPIPRPAYAREVQSSKGSSLNTTTPKSNTQEAEEARKTSVKESQDADSSGNNNIKFANDDETHLARQASVSSRRKSSNYTSSLSQRQLRNASIISSRDRSSSLPKHMKSNSSRFSFDMIGAASQEKLLEDRHREKALRKQTETPDPNVSYFDEEDDYDYENMMDDDGLEERIPGVNADWEDENDEGETFGQQNSIGGLTYFSMSTPVVPDTTSPSATSIVNTPSGGENIDAVSTTTEEPENEAQRSSQPPIAINSEDTDISTNTAPSRELSGLGLQGLGLDDSSIQHAQLSVPSQQEPNFPQYSSQKQDIEDDDLYFNDGMIDHNDYDPEGPEFDESVFDNDDTDQYGRPLAPLSSLPTLYSPPLIHTTSDSLNVSKRESAESPNQAAQEDHAITTSETQPQVHSPKPLLPTADLTQDTLSAYQSALAAAAYAAAASGRFRRDSTPGGYAGDESEGNLNDVRPYSPSVEDDFDYDDAYEDDPIIAEANAEALAYDSDGFYNQEFGFYSAPAGTEAQYANGGFFGPRGAEGITRNQSGRVREPNLTPITERSEYSNRNSIMSLPQLAGNMGHGSGSVVSPGLVQLAGLMSDQEDENMSLSALLKLRRGQWGGSQPSLPASGRGSPSVASPGDDHGIAGRTAQLGQWQQSQMGSSPSGQLAPWQQSQAGSSPSALVAPWHQQSSISPVEPQGNTFKHSRKGSTFSLASDYGRDSGTNSPNATTETQFNPLNPQLHTQFPQSYGPTHNLLRSPSSRTAPSPTAAMDSLNHRTTEPPSPNISSTSRLTSPTGTQFDQDSIPFSPSSGKPKEKGAELKKHRHTGSSDSISYMKEDDPVCGERWILERRRKADSGEEELLEREIISSGRI